MRESPEFYEVWSLYPDALFRQTSMIPAPRDSIDRKYPTGLSVGKFGRYSRSPVNWHARRIAHWSARRFRCEIHFEANGNIPHSERCAESKLWLVNLSLFPRKNFKAKPTLYKDVTRDPCAIYARF